LIAPVVLGAALVLAGCSSSDPEPAATPSASEPAFSPPAGVTLTAGGTSLRVGEPATVAYRLGDRVTSAVRVTVAKVKKGTIDDFRFFSLDEQTKTAMPYYVTLSVRNEGPAGLGGAALPLYVVDSTDANLPANDIVGEFEPCPTPTLPASFLPGATASVCLVYLVPDGRKLAAVSLQTGTVQDAVRWTR
jgi:hypothetical protein